MASLPIVRGSTIDLSERAAAAGGSTGLTAYTVRPDGDEKLPGIVVIHEIFGLDDEAKKNANRLAAMGYVVVVPDLYSDGGTRRCLRRTMQALSSGQGRAFDDIAAARQSLVDRDDCTGDVGVIGFCSGGAFALMCAAPARGFSVSSVNYGRLPQDPGALRGACPIIGSYGGRDRSLKGVAGKLDAKLTEMGIEHDIKEYPNAGHAFLNEGRPGPWFMEPVFKVMGVGPEPASAADAWQRIEAFLGSHLRQ